MTHAAGVDGETPRGDNAMAKKHASVSVDDGNGITDGETERIKACCWIKI